MRSSRRRSSRASVKQASQGHHTIQPRAKSTLDGVSARGPTNSLSLRVGGYEGSDFQHTRSMATHSSTKSCSVVATSTKRSFQSASQHADENALLSLQRLSEPSTTEDGKQNTDTTHTTRLPSLQRTKKHRHGGVAIPHADSGAAVDMVHITSNADARADGNTQNQTRIKSRGQAVQRVQVDLAKGRMKTSPMSVLSRITEMHLGLARQLITTRHQFHNSPLLKSGLAHRHRGSVSSALAAYNQQLYHHDYAAPGSTPRRNASTSRKTSKIDELLSQAEQDAHLGMQYQRMSQREHILLRPEPYIGSPEVVTERTWVLTKPLTQHDTSPIIDTDFNFIPGLYKIFDEILVNASDNVHRNSSSIKMKYINISIDPMTNQLSVENDGASIPVVMHPKEHVYVPELIFGHLLTSSNYDDSISRFTGGRHGYGAKLTNIFSKSFQITVGDIERKIIYHQEFQNNMSTITPALLINTQNKTVSYANAPKTTIPWKDDEKLRELVEPLLLKKSSFTRIQFCPDLTRFQVDKLSLNTSSEESAQTAIAAGSPAPPVVTHDKSRMLMSKYKSDPFAVFPPFMMPLFERRILDVASLMGRFGVKVSYNGKHIGVNSYQKYLELCPSFPLASTAATQTLDTSDTSDPENDAGSVSARQQNKDQGRVVTTNLDDNWFIGVCPRANQQSVQSGSQSLNHLSFVNSVATMRGGSHVHYIMDIVSRYICNYINQPNRRKAYELESEVSLGQVRQNLSVFVSCYIHNPSFDSQTKDTLITHIKGPQTINPPRGEAITAPAIPEAFLRKVCRDSGILDQIIASAQQRQHRQLLRKLDSATPQKTRRSGGLNIEKLDDALWAGSSRSRECTLILTEGDSAKALAVSGLSVLGRERFGIYPLKGKLLNVRDASKSSIANNKELVEIMQILGLKLTGSDRSNLRYGSILVMADQDHDGSHIKGLVINVLHTLCPDLVRNQSHQKKSDVHHDMLVQNTSQHQFVRLFVTPIVKASYTGSNYPMISIPKRSGRDQELMLPSQYITTFTNNAPGGNIHQAKRINDHISQRGKVLSFYSQQSYRQWWSSLPESLQSKFKCKYYKGLGTSTSAEGKEYFNDLPSHIIDLIYQDKQDDQSLDLAFSKDYVDARKGWVMRNSQGVFSDDYIRSYLLQSSPGSQQPSSLPGNQRKHHEKDHSRTFAARWTTISDFIHNELVQFSVADTARSLPSQLDGLKPSQRKIIYAALAKPLNSEVRVSQFAAYVSEKYVYHHGEQSLTAAVVNLAQDYPGTNNIPLLTGVGQFGTRYMGGKDAASPRYIYTRLGPLTPELFPLSDVPTLPQQEEEGTVIEPSHLLPVLPLMIINGSSGIGTGFSTDIPPHNPLHVLEATVQWLRGQPLRVISPLQIGMQSILTPAPNSTMPFDSKYQTIDDVDLSTIPVPDVHAPWEYTKPPTDIAIKHKYAWDDLYNHESARDSVPESEHQGELTTIPPTYTCTKWISTGRFHIDPHAKTLHITELPYNSSTASYKKFLFSMASTNPERTGPITIERIEERHTEHHVWFTLHFSDTAVFKYPEDEILSRFKLQSNVMLTNMNAFNNTNELHGFSDVRIPLAEYCTERLKTYEKRRSLLIEKKWQELELCKNKTQFCTLLMNGTIQLTNKTKKQLVLELHKLGFTTYDEIYKNSRSAPPSNENKDGDDHESDVEVVAVQDEHTGKSSTMSKLTMNSYNYLFKIPIIGATRERVAKIEGEMVKHQHDLASLTNITAKEMWLAEIAALQPKLEKYIESRHRVTSSHPFFARYGTSLGSNKNTTSGGGGTGTSHNSGRSAMSPTPDRKHSQGSSAASGTGKSKKTTVTKSASSSSSSSLSNKSSSKPTESASKPTEGTQKPRSKKTDLASSIEQGQEPEVETKPTAEEKAKTKAKAKAKLDAKRKKAKAAKLLAPLLKTTKKLNKHLEKQQDSIRRLQEKLQLAKSGGAVAATAASPSDAKTSS